jgi:PAS domain S-box-containing protein
MKKPHITPTNNETKMGENDFIVSKTDAKGIITYCNEIFMDLAGYEEKQLIGKNHNIIRHPDVPQVAFKLAWDLIKSGKEFYIFYIYNNTSSCLFINIFH